MIAIFERRDRTEHARAWIDLIANPACDVNGRARQFLGAFAQPGLGERSLMCAKRTGRDGIRAGFKIIAMDLLEDVRPFDQRLGGPERQRNVSAAAAELGAGRAVEQKNGLCGPQWELYRREAASGCARVEFMQSVGVAGCLAVSAFGNAKPLRQPAAPDGAW